jgi:antitoxin VapB
VRGAQARSGLARLVQAQVGPSSRANLAKRTSGKVRETCPGVSPFSKSLLTTERLAREVAKETGETITVAILKSLEERLLRLSGRRIAGDLAHQIMRIGSRCSALPDVDVRGPDEILGYDSDGTPR